MLSATPPGLSTSALRAGKMADASSPKARPSRSREIRSHIPGRRWRRILMEDQERLRHRNCWRKGVEDVLRVLREVFSAPSAMKSSYRQGRQEKLAETNAAGSRA